jgi:Rod binding domain-containing protein
MKIDGLSLGNATAGWGMETPRLKAGSGKLEDAARQFESLLMAELLRVSRGEDSGWLGTGDEHSMSSAMDMAQEYFAQAMTAQGGIGIVQYVKEHLVTTGE